MNHPNGDPVTSPVADPAAVAVVAKVKRLMLVTMAATFVALAIVLVFIGYRLFNAGGSAPATAADVSAQLPKGARVVSTALNGERIAVTIELPTGMEIHLFDAKSLKPAGRLRLTPAP